MKKNPVKVAAGRLGGKATAKALTPEERAKNASKAGQVGSQARKAALTPEQRTAIARKAAKARWRWKKA